MRAAASILRGLPGHRKAAPQLLPEAVLQEWLGEGADMRSVDENSSLALEVIVHSVRGISASWWKQCSVGLRVEDDPWRRKLSASEVNKTLSL